MKNGKHKIICIVLSIIMVCLSSTPIAAFDETAIANVEHNCSEHSITENYDNTISPQSLHPSCWAGNHDFTGDVNFEDYHIIHDWNNTGVCKIFYYRNVSCTRWLCISTKDIIYHEGTINCNDH